MTLKMCLLITMILKNMSVERTSMTASLFIDLPEQDAFLESMAEAASAVVDHLGKNIAFINHGRI